ncbi:site-specific integrase [Chryseobacterium sp. ON_d1]|uniref:tyrosine-type recombinase/integrase n=1 Tax=Chryseobacterium sp. ON_d1 TaxID=2583211 RepID=UPI00115B280C|nr:site-specific integrase [Chryseobacterium sp. ON_d1]GEJ45993.1 hypothetical protein CRS_26010 [Chryseobacterium sp. ON_d1]
MKPHHTPLKVYPVTWDTELKKNLDKDWEIRYVYFHPLLPPEGKIIRFKGMNHCKSLYEKQEVTKRLIHDEVKMLRNGFNPVTKEYENIDEDLIIPETPFLKAFDIALKSFKGETTTIEDYENSLKHIKNYAKKLSLDLKEIGDIRKRDIKQLLISMSNDNHSNYRVNKTRDHLSKFFSHFTELEIFEANFIRSISLLEWNPETPHILRSEDDWRRFHSIKDINYNEYMFLFIFLYSCCRFEEIAKVKKSDVELDKSLFWITVKKGGKHKRTMKAINMASWKYWKMYYDMANEDEYLFSHNRVPGSVPIAAQSLYVAAAKYLRKVGLNITGYKLKHTFSNLISKNYDLTIAQGALGHTSIKTTMKYAIDHQEHQIDKNRKLKVNIGN